MPVTPQSSGPTDQNARIATVAGKKGSQNQNPQDMVKLKVPGAGEIGHLGVQIQSEQEFSQLYQIFADDTLGSGQFGTVYGGMLAVNCNHCNWVWTSICLFRNTTKDRKTCCRETDRQTEVPKQQRGRSTNRSGNPSGSLIARVKNSLNIFVINVHLFIESSSSRRCWVWANVRDSRSNLCRHGENERWHVGDDSKLGKGQTFGEDNAIFGSSSKRKIFIEH